MMRASITGLVGKAIMIGVPGISLLSLLGMKVLLELVPSQVSWGRHHRVGGSRQAIIGNWRGWDAAYRKLEGEMKPP